MTTTDSDITDSYAAVDLGSNSFHMVVARVVDGKLNVIDRIREPVRLANGLDRYRNINDATWERAVNCLQMFGERIKGIPAEHVRAVGTNTFRRANNSITFHTAAEDALGHPIEIISGIEEARLIYSGAIQALPQADVQRLFIDIGGSSTEVIIGKNTDTITMESFEMGCVTFSQKFFPKGKVTRKKFILAYTAAQLELEQWANRIKYIGWQEAVGTSGTIKTIARVLMNQNWSMHGIDREGLEKLTEFLINAKKLDDIELEGLSDDRKPVFAGGVAILFATMDLLGIESLQACDNALREGVLYELIGTDLHHNIQTRTIKSLVEQFHIDTKQAARVQQTAESIFNQINKDWRLENELEKKLLKWASLVHEVGLSISHGHYHHHGAYILSNADMPGFTQQEQALLSGLVRSHRRKMTLEDLGTVSEKWQRRLLQLCLILRVAVIIHRARLDDNDIDIKATVNSMNHLSLTFPENYLEYNELIAADLDQEAKIMEKLGFLLEVS